MDHLLPTGGWWWWCRALMLLPNYNQPSHPHSTVHCTVHCTVCTQLCTVYYDLYRMGTRVKSGKGSDFRGD